MTTTIPTWAPTLAPCGFSPNRCKVIKYRRHYDTRGRLRTIDHAILCSDVHDNQTLAELTRLSCVYTRQSLGRIEFKFTIFIVASSKRPIIDASLQPVFELLNKFAKFWSLEVNLIDFKGFNIESTINFRYASIGIQSDLNLYKENRLVTSCEDFRGVNSSSTGFIFQERPVYGIYKMILNRPRSKHPMCSLFFRNARIDQMYLSYMVNSYHMKSVFRTADPIDTPIASLNSTIKYLQCEKMYGVDVDSKFLNPLIFVAIKKLDLLGHINSIENDVFKPFRNIKILNLDYYILEVIRKQGIEWLKGINSHLQVNLSNRTDVKINQQFAVKIELGADRGFWSDETSRYFYDHDFCLFVEYPFKQLVFIAPLDEMKERSYRNMSSYTCTELWLYQFYAELKNVVYFDMWAITYKLNVSNFTACRFQERVNLCQKDRFSVNSSVSKSDHLTSFDLVIVFELVSIVLASLFSAIGIVTNLMTIRVITHKKNQKTMDEKHYTYMSWHCVFNVAICSIQVVTLINECQYPFGLFCSSVNHVIGVQYVKIVLGEFVNSVCRLMANFAYFAFSLCRLSKIGKDHAKFVEFMKDIGIKKYLVASLLVSAGFSVCKALRFKINIFSSSGQIHPQPINQFFHDWQYLSKYVAITVLNIIFDFLNYFLFVVVHLVVDLILIKQLKSVLLEKEEKMKELKRSAKEIENATKENEESRRRIVFMVVFNSTLNFLTKVPLMLTSMNDLRLLIQRPYLEFEKEMHGFASIYQLIDEYDTSLFFRFYCSTEKMCQVFQSFGNCLFLFSLTTVLYFLKRFDKNFRAAYQTCFNQNKKKNVVI